MKKNLLFLVSIIYMSANAQAPDWQWVKKISGINHDALFNTAMDAKNNLYATGSFNSPKLTLDNLTLVKKYQQDYFIAKYDANGKVIWAKELLDADQGASVIAIDQATTNLFLSGTLTTQIIVGTDTLKNTSAFSGSNSFIAKCDSVGTIRWIKALNGKNYSSCTSISIDADGNSYFAGMTAGKTFMLDNDTLINYTGTNPNINYLYIIKLSPTGTLLWKKTTALSGSIYPTKIVTYKDAVYATGIFSGDSLIIENDTLLPKTGQDGFLVKFDTLGNKLWTKAIAGSNDEQSQQISVTKSGDLYFTQSFNSPEIKVNGVSVFNSSPQSSLLVVKFTASGSTTWIKTVSPAGGNFMNAISQVCDSENNLYLGGYSNSPYLEFAGDTIKNNSTYGQIFIFKYSADGTPQWALSTNEPGALEQSVNNLTCDSKDNIYACGMFLSPSLKFGRTTLTNAGINSNDLFVTRLSKCSAPPAAICMVSVDSVSKNNVIVWDKATYTNVDSFIIYREIGTNNFQPIASIPYDSAGEFVDTVRKKYFPNTGDPNAGTYRYKIQALDTCNNLSVLSAYHNTIFITSNNGNFTWAQLYSIENGSNPVSSYVLMRDDLSNNQWHAVASVAGTQQTITDPDFKNWEKTARWRVETMWNISCTIYHKGTEKNEAAPTKYGVSRSNILKFSTTPLNEQELSIMVAMYPNPGKGNFSVESAIPLLKMEIINTLGETVYSKQMNALSEKVDIGGQPAGMYYIRLQTSKGMLVKKYILQE